MYDAACVLRCPCVYDEEATWRCSGNLVLCGWALLRGATLVAYHHTSRTIWFRVTKWFHLSLLSVVPVHAQRSVQSCSSAMRSSAGGCWLAHENLAITENKHT